MENKMKRFISIMIVAIGLASAALALEYAVSYTQYELACARIKKGKTPLPEGTVYPVAPALKAVASEYLIIDDGVLREKTTEEKTAYDVAQAAATLAAHEARQEAKPLALKTAENNFLLICDALTGSTSHAKLTFAQLAQAGESITDTTQRVSLTLQLLSIDAEAKREGGLAWWDDCEWHPEIVE
jgi:hypothetical protein